MERVRNETKRPLSAIHAQMSTQMTFSLPLCHQMLKGNEKQHKGLLLIIILGGVLGSVLILIRVAVLLVALGLFFFDLLVFIEYFLTDRRTTGSMSGAANLAATLARKRNKVRLGSGIGRIPLGEGVVESWKLIMSVHGKAHMSLDSLNIPAIHIYLRSNGPAHAENATKGPLDERITAVTMRGARVTRCSRRGRC